MDNLRDCEVSSSGQVLIRADAPVRTRCNDEASKVATQDIGRNNVYMRSIPRGLLTFIDCGYTTQVCAQSAVGVHGQYRESEPSHRDMVDGYMRGYE